MTKKWPIHWQPRLNVAVDETAILWAYGGHSVRRATAMTGRIHRIAPSSIERAFRECGFSSHGTIDLAEDRRKARALFDSIKGDP